jgi:hypothetical protein
LFELVKITGFYFLKIHFKPKYRVNGKKTAIYYSRIFGKEHRIIDTLFVILKEIKR